MYPCISVWNFQIKYILVYTEYMLVYTFTAYSLSWLRGHILVHTRTSEYIQCATALFLPASCLPACTLLARLARYQEQISLLLFRQLPSSPVATSFSAAAEPPVALAAPASGSEIDSDVVWATSLHCPWQFFPLFRLFVFRLLKKHNP